MADSRKNPLLDALGERRRPGHLPGQRRRRAADAFVAITRARRAAADMADAMLLAFGTETAEHSRDVERLALRIADRVGLSGRERRRVGIAARLHDIGKVAMPRSVLEKPRKLNKKEWKLMYTHTVVGEEILETVEELRDVAGAVRHSHERWDGEGYPDGLSGEEIPLASRIVFCADTFDAICSDRPYRRARSAAEALAEIRDCSGTQFEPRVVDALADVVRADLYGQRTRVRRRAHSQLATMLVIVLSLGGSVAAGMAAPSSSPPPTPQSSVSPSSATPEGGLGIGSPFGAGAVAAAHSGRPDTKAAADQGDRTHGRSAPAHPAPAPHPSAQPPSPPRPSASQPKPQAAQPRPLAVDPASVPQDVTGLGGAAVHTADELTAEVSQG